MFRRTILLAISCLFATSLHAATFLGFQAGAYDSDAQAYFNSVNALCGVSLPGPIKGVFSNYIVNEKTVGNWGGADMEYVLLTSSSCVAGVNVAQSTLYPVTWNGAPTFSILTGMNGDGSAAYGDTGVNFSALPRLSQNRAHSEIWASPGSSGSNLGLIGSVGGLLISNLSNRSTRLTSGTAILDTGVNCAGLSWADRPDSTHITTGCGTTINSDNVSKTSAARTANHVALCQSNGSLCGSAVNMKFVYVGAPLNNMPAHTANVASLVNGLIAVNLPTSLLAQATTNQCDIVSTAQSALIAAFYASIFQQVANLDQLYMASPDECLSELNWANPALYPMAPQSNTGIIFREWQGFQNGGGGINSYIDTGVNVSALTHLTQNSAHASAYVLSNTAGVAENDLGSLNSDLFTLIPSDVAGHQSVQLTASSAVNAGTAAVGMIEADRNSSSAVNVCTNGVLTGSVLGSTSTAPPAAHVILLRGGSTPAYSDNVIAEAAVGSGFSPSDCATLYNAVQAYLTGLGTFNVPSDAVSGLPYFTQASNALIAPTGYRVSLTASCPASDTNNSTFASFPFSVCSPQNIAAMIGTTYSSGLAGHDIWANRYNAGPNTKPNQNPPTILTSTGTECRFQFTTKARGDAMTLAEIAYSVGYGAHDVSGYGYNDILEAAGLPDATMYTAFLAQVDTLCTVVDGIYLTPTPDSVAVLTNGRLADITSMPRDAVMVDWEVQDNHSTSETNSFFTQAVAIAHSKSVKIELYTNNLLGGTAPENGITASNTDTLQGIVDYFDLLITDNSLTSIFTVLHSITGQEALFTSPNYAKMQASFQLGNQDQAGGNVGTTVADAITIRQHMIARGYAGVRVFSQGALRGGADPCRPTNQKIGIIATGVNYCSAALP